MVSKSGSMSRSTTECSARVDSALEFQAAGLKIFPLHSPTDGACSCGRPKCSSVGKHPRTPNGLHAASADAEQVRDWWTAWPDANIGLVTGDGLVILDLDSEDAIQEAESRGLPRTLEVRTAKGRHLYFEGEARTRARILPGMDIRGAGGYVVAPPSIHASGHVYEWLNADMEVAPLPEWIDEALSAPQEARAEATLDNAVLPEGARNDGLFLLACDAARAGLFEPEITAALLAANASRCKPPLDEDEVQRIAGSAAKIKVLATPRPGADKALLDMKLGALPTLVYVALRTFANREGSCFPAVETVAKRAGIGRTATFSAIRTIEAAGLVLIANRGLCNSNRYTLLDPRDIAHKAPNHSADTTTDMENR
jgi:hypothetical protein